MEPELKCESGMKQIEDVIIPNKYLKVNNFNKKEKKILLYKDIIEWIKKLWCIYTVEFYAAERKKELRPFATAWTELESIMLSEISQAMKYKYHMISPLSGT